jgi:hypothetical protein
MKDRIAFDVVNPSVLLRSISFVMLTKT